jgi:hypothetical protein
VTKDVTDSTSAIETYGDTKWLTATGFSKAGDKMDLVDSPNSKAVTIIQTGLSTFDAATDTVTAGNMVSLTGIATTKDVTDAVTSIETYGDINWPTANVSGLATSKDLATVDGIVDDIKAVTVKIDTMMVLDGAVYQLTANALELAPSGSGLDAKGVRDAIGLASANLDTQLASIISTGTGSNTVVYTLSTGDTTDVTVEVYTDATYSTLVAKGITDAFGSVTFHLDDGTYYLIRKKAGADFVNPDIKTVS